MPHEVTGHLSTVPLLKIESFACTCAAGLSECCKHIVATLLLLNRYHFSYSLMEKVNHWLYFTILHNKMLI